jgi:hypothetical protein
MERSAHEGCNTSVRLVFGALVFRLVTVVALPVKRGRAHDSRVLIRRVLLVCSAVGLLVVTAAPAKTLDRAVLVGSDGAWVRVAGSAVAFDNLGRDPASRPRRANGGYVRLYFVGPGDFPANRARYYPGQRCIALDWPTYERSCRALNPRLVREFGQSHRLARFAGRPTVLSRLRYLTSSGASPGLAGLTGSVELAVIRRGAASSAVAGCYDFAATWDGPAAKQRPRRLSVCRNGVLADDRLHPLSRSVWEWLRRNVGPPDPPEPEPPPAAPIACSAVEVETLIERFVTAFNDGDLTALDGTYAQEPEFEWYATGAPGERILPLAGDRASLVPYFQQRHELGERLKINSVRFNGNTVGSSRTYGNFEYTLTRIANDLAPTTFAGKGAALCYRERSDLLFVWAMARAPESLRLRSRGHSLAHLTHGAFRQ